MSDTKNTKTESEKGCSSCGDDRVMLTEEKDAPPRCGGCGKSLPSGK